MAIIGNQMRISIAFTLGLLLAACTTIPKSEGVAYVNGRLFDGDAFVARPIYVVDGVFRTTAPRVITHTMDLQGRYVLPPLAEAHNHWLEPDRIDAYIRDYLAHGVFYVMDQANVPPIAAQVRAKTNRHSAVDYQVAVLGFTGPGGHPIQIVKQFVTMGVMPSAWTDEATMDRNALLIVANEHDVDERWPLLRASGTDFVKVFLEFSEEYDQRKNDPAFRYRRGIDPKLVSSIVRRAHADGLRVSAHIYSATDFRNALTAGVDLIAHMPGTGAGAGGDGDLQRFLITDEDALLAARLRTPVITTLGWLDDLREKDRSRADLVEHDVIAPNLSKLRNHGARLLIGSDQFRETPLEELFILARLGIPNKQIIRTAVIDTPRAIFPGRKIGALADDHEASFLVLEGNPLDDLANIRNITLRVKQGVVVKP